MSSGRERENNQKDLTLKWGSRVLALNERTHIMGILNVTPDSFSDGGHYFELAKAVERGIEMARDGADIIDVGGESTRPYSQKISSSEEIDRVVPVIEKLAGELTPPISIDTYKAKVAREALKAGASMVNDISALRFDPEMGSIVANAGVPVILMHMRGTPQDMQNNPAYNDLVSEVIDFLKNAVERSENVGVDRNLTILDPGIGFGKTFNDNLKIIRDLQMFRDLGRPLLYGPSNKAFIGNILEKDAHKRDTGTMAAIACGVMNGANIVRVHNVKKAIETVRVADAIRRGHTG